MFLALAVAGAKMMSAIPEKIVLRSTTKISLNDRFVNETDLYNMMPVTYSSVVFISVNFTMTQFRAQLFVGGKGLNSCLLKLLSTILMTM